MNQTIYIGLPCERDKNCRLGAHVPCVDHVGSAHPKEAQGVGRCAGVRTLEIRNGLEKLLRLSFVSSTPAGRKAGK